MMRTVVLSAAAAAALAGCAAAPAPPTTPQAVAMGDPAMPRGREWLVHSGFIKESERVHALVQRDPNFGGFVLRWTPEPHALVMFTGNAEARLRRYTRDPRFKAVSVDLSLAELERMKDSSSVALHPLGLRCYSVDGDEERNTVTVGAPADELVKVRAAIAEGRIKPPPKLRLKEEGCAEFR